MIIILFPDFPYFLGFIKRIIYMYLSSCLYVYLSIYISVYMSICLYIYLSVYMSLSIYISVCIDRDIAVLGSKPRG
jgi:hypothetical protein